MRWEATPILLGRARRREPTRGTQTPTIPGDWAPGMAGKCKVHALEQKLFFEKFHVLLRKRTNCVQTVYCTKNIELYFPVNVKRRAYGVDDILLPATLHSSPALGVFAAKLRHLSVTSQRVWNTFSEIFLSTFPPYYPCSRWFLMYFCPFGSYFAG